ncbi:unnamed protein product [Gongylonema pulchrum]|uniref:Ornithine decarboxylase n=1 Tax=Gongylonema pulchrum TaxID=637853 RepID=A0A183EDJ4_9BILA|nr:unnamed protein product [Gongylonema pulchrum]
MKFSTTVFASRFGYCYFFVPRGHDIMLAYKQYQKKASTALAASESNFRKCNSDSFVIAPSPVLEAMYQANVVALSPFTEGAYDFAKYNAKMRKVDPVKYSGYGCTLENNDYEPNWTLAHCYNGILDIGVVLQLSIYLTSASLSVGQLADDLDDRFISCSVFQLFHFQAFGSFAVPECNFCLLWIISFQATPFLGHDEIFLCLRRMWTYLLGWLSY